MTEEIIITVVAASRNTGDHTPAEIAYFTTVQGDIYGPHLPDGWIDEGSTPIGTPYRKGVTVSLPEFIHSVPGGIRSDYKSQDGNRNLALIKVPAIRVVGDIEQAIDEAIKSLTITAPTSTGKREEIPFTIVSTTKMFENKHPE